MFSLKHHVALPDLIRADIDRDKLAEQWIDLGRLPMPEIERAIAKRLDSPHWAADLCPDGEPADIDPETFEFHHESMPDEIVEEATNYLL